MFYFLDRGGIDNQLAQNPPFSGQTTINYTDGVRINLQGQAPANSTDPTLAGTVDMPSKGPLNVDLNNPAGVSVIAYPKNDRNSYAYQWNLLVERQLSSNTSMSAVYVASRGLSLMTLFNLNRQLYDTASGTKLFPGLGNVQYNTTVGHSYYDSLQLQLQRRLTNGLQFSAAYTYAHAIDNSPGTLDQQSDRVDFFNFGAERANSNLDIRHRFVFTSLYELPFGHGKQWGSNWNPVVQGIVGGWQLNPILTLQTGLPFDLIDQGQQQNTRPDLVGSLHQMNNINGWFNTSAFAEVPSTGGVYDRPGTAPRNPFHGPGRKFMDLAVFKNFPIGERVNTQFRVQVYNITNTPQYDQPNGSFTSGDFGKVKNTLLFTERQMELALRITF